MSAAPLKAADPFCSVCRGPVTLREWADGRPVFVCQNPKCAENKGESAMSDPSGKMAP